MKQNSLLTAFVFALMVALLSTFPLYAQDAPKSAILFSEVRVFDGTSPQLSAPMSVLIEGNIITKIAPRVEAPAGATVIPGRGRTLMPGLIGAHVHTMFESIGLQTGLTSELKRQRTCQPETGRAFAKICTSLRRRTSRSASV